VEEFFVQCLLYKEVNVGILKTVSWIPEKFADKGRVLKLKGDDGVWSNGWIVQETYGNNTKEFILSHERDYAHQREASDI